MGDFGYAETSYLLGTLYVIDAMPFMKRMLIYSGVTGA
jgi:hypothetical protein